MVGVTVAFGVALVVTVLVWRVGPRIGYVDRPDSGGLKAHTLPAVPLGGVAVFVGVHLGMAVEGAADGWLMASSALLLSLGLVDDRRGLPPAFRLGVEMCAAGLLVAGSFGDRGLAAMIVIGLLAVTAVNAVNLFDGLDGLAATAALVTCIGVLALSVVRGTDAGPASVLAASLAAFLLLNWHPARVFLGDSGAYVVGITLAFAVARVSDQVDELLVATGLLGVFLIDVAATVVRRLRARVHVFSGDRNHTYDRLVAGGIGVSSVALGAGALQAVLALGVIGLDVFLPAGYAVVGVGLLGIAGVTGAIALTAVRSPHD
jgi:UDP-GlcNAc:undecaprenyl-phosphate/decaprenyl-phosphate GlcNAc-1-phosphate transferase